MGDTTAFTNLFVIGIIALISNSILLLIIAGVNLTAGIIYLIIFPFTPLCLVAFIISIVLFLLALGYVVITVIGSVLGFIYKDRVRKIGAICLIIINPNFIPLFAANYLFPFTGFRVFGSIKDYILFATQGIIRVFVSAFEYALSILYTFRLLFVFCLLIGYAFKIVYKIFKCVLFACCILFVIFIRILSVLSTFLEYLFVKIAPNVFTGRDTEKNRLKYQ